MTNSNDDIQLPVPHKRSWRDWIETQPPFQSPDPRFELRLSTPDDFPEIYALLNSVYDSKRTTAEYDWMYRQNPYGIARCELAIEKSSGAIVSTNGHFPWPVAKGEKSFEADQSADSATLQRMQRQGLVSLRIKFQQSHSWNNQQIVISLPNEASRAALKKHNRPDLLVSQIPFAKKILDWRRFQATKGVPSYVANLTTPAANALTRSSSRKPVELTIKPIHRFEQEHQTLSLDYCHSDGFWCPHGAQWMNWRYFGHPTKNYVARGLYRGDELKAFAVVQLNGDNAMLMELISSNPQHSKILLTEIEGIAREAGAITIDTYASESWKHWPLIKQQRYFMRPSTIFITTRTSDYPDALFEKNWLFLPGDSDVF